MPSSPQQGPSSAADHNPPATTDHNYVRSPVLQHAINNNVQDFTLQPNRHEQYDLLTFFANVKQKVEDIIKSRLQTKAIKWYLSVQEELVKDVQNGEDTTTHS